MSYNIVYKNPSVKLITQYSINNNICYKLWLDSREQVISKTSEGFLKVGSEVIKDEKEYRERIMKMGLQYTQFSAFTFEIEGSILFRDILFTLNEMKSWACSLRFLNSTYEGFDERNYPVSSEYKDKEKWTAQVYKYFDKIHETMVTDENRMEMPFCMHSKYWIQFDWKTLIGFLSMLKMKMPFYYEVYGKLFEQQVNSNLEIDITNYYVPFIDSSIAQYFYKDYNKISSKSDWNSFTKDEDSGVVILKKDIGMLLFSQFIRQKNSRIKGLYDLVCSTSPDEVIYSRTPVRIMFTGDDERFMRTISNRTCFFSMSSGNNINSWSIILDLILKDMSVNDFENLIPCKINSDKHIVCKYFDDVKFRLDSVEKRNLPCGLAVMIRDILEKRNKYDNTNLSKLYLELFDKWESKGILPVDHELVEKYRHNFSAINITN